MEDCDKALQINNKWTKAYLRKAIAITFEPIDEKNFNEISEVIQKGLETTDPSTDAEVIKELNDWLEKVKDEHKFE